MTPWWKFRPAITPLRLSLSLAVFFLVCLNGAVIARLYAIGRSEAMTPGFILSLPVFAVSAFNLLLLPFSGRHTARVVFIPLLLLSAVASYATCNYGVIFSKEMIGNIVDTDFEEATSYLNLTAALWFLFLGIVPAGIVSRLDIVPSRRKYAHPLISACCSLLAICIIAGVYFQDYAMTLRNYPDLKKLVVPTYALASGVKFARGRYFTSKLPYRDVGIDARLDHSPGSSRSLTVLVVGETARADNYSLNGYERDTNPHTTPLGVVSYRNVTSCGTETAVSVPCMFSGLTRAGYSQDKAASQDNALDILKRAGVQLLWIDNNSGCKGVCKNIPTISIRAEYADRPGLCDSSGCLDEAFIPELEKRLKGLKPENTVIVLHLMGSHGPAYFKRYPRNFGAFKPDCRQSDVQNCPAQDLVNTYDNTILYTDDVLSRVIQVLQKHQDQWDTSLIYASDHGESLGENGLYLHGLPYGFAPRQQKHVPLIAWFSPSFLQKANLSKRCIARDADREFSHDNIYHTLLGIAGVRTKAYAPDMDLFAHCREPKLSGVSTGLIQFP
ncbi:MAG TPA: phosphoethanolamine--lipid A transferase [Patescibacteria group bacterium]|nr:phosphoethanolamine--lipid A transferase [Patescibacteria group bacterium]